MYKTTLVYKWWQNHINYMAKSISMVNKRKKTAITANRMMCAMCKHHVQRRNIFMKKKLNKNIINVGFLAIRFPITQLLSYLCLFRFLSDERVVRMTYDFIHFFCGSLNVISISRKKELLRSRHKHEKVQVYPWHIKSHTSENESKKFMQQLDNKFKWNGNNYLPDLSNFRCQSKKKKSQQKKTRKKSLIIFAVCSLDFNWFTVTIDFFRIRFAHSVYKYFNKYLASNESDNSHSGKYIQHCRFM